MWLGVHSSLGLQWHWWWWCPLKRFCSRREITKTVAKMFLIATFFLKLVLVWLTLKYILLYQKITGQCIHLYQPRTFYLNSVQSSRAYLHINKGFVWASVLNSISLNFSLQALLLLMNDYKTVWRGAWAFSPSEALHALLSSEMMSCK